jgi:N-acetylmuramoyl-L-alanine amidase
LFHVKRPNPTFSLSVFAWLRCEPGVIAIGAEGILRRNLLLTAIGVAAADVVLAGGAMDANADDVPKIYTREDWGAAAPKRPTRLLSRPPDHIIVHHTASPNTSETSRAHAFALSRQIQRFHMGTRGWDDIGEQLTISRGGIVMEGRAGSLQAIAHNGLVVGAQSLHHNRHTIGIENEGTYVKDDVPGKLWKSLVEVCAWLCTVHGLEPATAIVGHRDYNDTDCPGDALYRRLPKLRKDVAHALGRRTGDPGDDDPPEDKRVLQSHRRHRTTRH